MATDMQEELSDGNRSDWEGLEVELHILQGLDEALRGEFVEADFLDRLIEEIK